MEVISTSTKGRPCSKPLLILLVLFPALAPDTPPVSLDLVAPRLEKVGSRQSR